MQFGSSAEESWTEDTKVVSKATIQTGFRKLYTTERKLFLLRTPAASERLPDRQWIKKAISTSEGTQPRNPWVVGEASLRRGRLVEVEVELRADPIFRISAIASAYSDLLESNKELFGGVDLETFNKIEDINSLLQQLMAGLIPLKCRVTDYVVVEHDGSRYLVHREAVNQIHQDQRSTVRDFYLVGVAETGLFWKDIRRVLFTGARFRLLCRLNNNELSSSWTAVKLTEVLGEVAPGIKATIQDFSERGLWVAVAPEASTQKAIEPRVAALCAFGEGLSEKGGLTLSDEDRERIRTTASRVADLMTSVDSSRKAFQAIEDLLSSRFNNEIDRAAVSALRVAVSKQYGLLPGAGVAPSADVVSTPLPHAGHSAKDELFMDAEIIAIYW